MPKKKEKHIEPFWNDLVSCYFQFCREKFNDVPTFDGSQPRDLKNIIAALRKRCEDKGNEWAHDTATTRFRSFLEYAYLDSWLRDNWILPNINRHKDKIFFKISRNN